MTNSSNIAREFLRLPSYFVDGVLYKLGSFLFTPRPRFLCFPVTFRCNSRCQMCNMWQNPDSTEEIGLNKIEEVLSNKVFSDIEDVVLHGGEPTLRKDISEIFKIVVRSCPKVKNITSSSNGLLPQVLKKRVDEILSAVDSTSVNLCFTVSIDGLKESHEKIRGIPGGFERALESLEILKDFRRKYPFDVQIITVIQPQNVKDLQAMQSLADDREVEIVFQPMMIDTFYDNSAEDTRLQFSESQYHQYREFIQETFAPQKDPKSLYWRNYLEMVAGGKRKIPCAYDRYVLSLYPTGEVLPCAKENWILFGNVHQDAVDDIWFSRKSKRIRKRMRKEVCPTCTFYCGAEYSLKKEFFTYFFYYVKANVSSVFNRDNS